MPTRRPESLPLGIKQRLQLAVAVLHEPAMLILDEPTSGVDPVARDAFWRTLIDLSRDDGVTIFVTTHFMNEAERCDRISLMHAGKVLAVGAPTELVRERGSDSSRRRSSAISRTPPASRSPSKTADADAAAAERRRQRRLRRCRRRASTSARLWAYARREAMELRRDPIRLPFALARPDHPDAGFRLRHLVRHRKPADRRVRPGQHAAEPRVARRFQRLALFLEQKPIAPPRSSSSGCAAANYADRARESRRISAAICWSGRRPEVDATSTAPMTFRGETRKRLRAGVVSAKRPRSPTGSSGRAADGAADRYRACASATTRPSSASTRWCRACSC